MNTPVKIVLALLAGTGVVLFCKLMLDVATAYPGEFSFVSASLIAAGIAYIFLDGKLKP